MTIAMLIQNTLEAYQFREGILANQSHGRAAADAAAALKLRPPYLRRQSVVPSGLSSRITPACASSSRSRSASLKSRALRAASRAAMRHFDGRVAPEPWPRYRTSSRRGARQPEPLLGIQLAHAQHRRQLAEHGGQLAHACQAGLALRTWLH